MLRASRKDLGFVLLVSLERVQVSATVSNSAERHLNDLRGNFKTNNPEEDYKLSKMIDKGAFGKVFAAQRIRD